MRYRVFICLVGLLKVTGAVYAEPYGRDNRDSALVSVVIAHSGKASEEPTFHIALGVVLDDQQTVIFPRGGVDLNQPFGLSILTSQGTELYRTQNFPHYQFFLQIADEDGYSPSNSKFDREVQLLSSAHYLQITSPGLPVLDCGEQGKSFLRLLDSPAVIRLKTRLPVRGMLSGGSRQKPPFHALTRAPSGEVVQTEVEIRGHGRTPFCEILRHDLLTYGIVRSDSAAECTLYRLHREFRISGAPSSVFPAGTPIVDGSGSLLALIIPDFSRVYQLDTFGLHGAALCAFAIVKSASSTDSARWVGGK